MTPAPSDPIGINAHVVYLEQQVRDGHPRAYYRCSNCTETAERPRDFRAFGCGGGEDE